MHFLGLDAIFGYNEYISAMEDERKLFAMDNNYIYECYSGALLHS
jgi:hypothetical protein